ncbi:NAD-dependent epimerase/dehydratase family protein [Sedimentitalea todarodis]|uniref:NAD(P)-dependent oxidoreductase n=1 Tax=Sedimentitalea todarodis TaxID=1631240 RepID=A0ABU3VK22_9RHOB|nr:NAD(P)-dependent oxidoreductase [Sedimentitalea todarodis]MDU9006537.1 NAD(P)-dependent oxidoreductase [Sedimentitalea todarodis]
MQFPKTMVLGATGRIGMILRKSWDPQAISWQTRKPQAGAGWVVLDPLTDPESLKRAADGCEAILCLAGVVPGRSGAGQSGAGKPGAIADNIALAEAALRVAAPGARVLLASSAAVYGATPGLLREDHPPVPLSEYGRAKAVMERRGAELGAARGVAVTALRIGNVAGVDAILGGWAPGFRLDQFADGRTPRRSYIGVQTLARVLRDLIIAPDLPGILNVAAPGAIEMGALLKAADLDWTPRPAPDTAIAKVELCTGRLARFIRFDADDSSAAAMVAQWRKAGSDKGQTA